MDPPVVMPPRALSFALQRFTDRVWMEQARSVPVGKSTGYVDGETLVFKLPAGGVIDLRSISLGCRVRHVSTAAGAATTGAFYLGQLIRRLEVTAGGTQLGLNNIQDYGFVYNIHRRLGEMNTLDTTSNQVYELQDLNLAAAGTAEKEYLMNDFRLGALASSIRYLPMSILPEVEIRITWALGTDRISPAATSTLTIEDPVLYYTRCSFKEAMIDRYVGSRIESGGFEFAIPNASLFSGASFNGGSSTMNYSIATQSLDYLLGFSRNVTLNRTNFFSTSSCAVTNSRVPTDMSTHQFILNGIPLSSWPLSSGRDSWQALCNALDASQNTLVDPKCTTFDQWTNNGNGDARFLFMHRFALPTAGDESNRFICGYPTYGASLPGQYVIGNASAINRTPHVLAFHTSTIEIGPGKTVQVVV